MTAPTSEQAMKAVAAQYGLVYVDLSNVTIPPSAIEYVPESIAREFTMLPLFEGDGCLTAILSDLANDVVNKLSFILNRQINVVLSTRESILEAINHYYGPPIDECPDAELHFFPDWIN